jgi:hypothetical protein
MAKRKRSTAHDELVRKWRVPEYMKDEIHRGRPDEGRGSEYAVNARKGPTLKGQKRESHSLRTSSGGLPGLGKR